MTPRRNDLTKLEGLDPSYSFTARASDNEAFFSTKTYDHSVGLSTCFRQWRALSHCRFLHGYALKVDFRFASQQLDGRNWAVDFGGLKPVKAWLEEMFDHKTVVASDDPQISIFKELAIAGMIQLQVVPAVGCEAFAHMIYKHVVMWLSVNYPHTSLINVTVSEHNGNSASFGRLHWPK